MLGNRPFRRLILGLAVSYVGDGMSFVAVAWLAIQLAPEATAGLWVGGAVAAYTLPGVVGALAFGRRLRRLRAERLMTADCVVRAVFLGAVPLLWLAGALTLPLYVALLALSSLLHAWGVAGQYTVLAELLPQERRLAGNAVVGSLNFAAVIAGPAIAGVLVTYVSAALVLGVDALTYVFLAILVALSRLPRSGQVFVVEEGAGGGFALLRSHPELLGLLALTWFFNFSYGPVEVALPLHVTYDLHAPGTLLGLYWTLFGVGAVLGGLAVGALQRSPLWPVLIAIVIGWGLTLLPFGWDSVPTTVTVACFALGGAIYGPFVALSMTLMQAKSPPQHLAAMLAARSAALLTASPIGTALGGPLSTALGPRLTISVSGVATLLLGIVASVLLLARRRSQ